jgi:hypothetical protein
MRELPGNWRRPDPLRRHEVGVRARSSAPLLGGQTDQPESEYEFETAHPVTRLTVLVRAAAARKKEQDRSEAGDPGDESHEIRDVVLMLARVHEYQHGRHDRERADRDANGSGEHVADGLTRLSLLMVMERGRYRFGDHWKLGLPMLVLVGVLAVFPVPVISSF